MKSDALLTRLQAANPEPLIVLTDSFDLFNEITASPGRSEAVHVEAQAAHPPARAGARSRLRGRCAARLDGVRDLAARRRRRRRARRDEGRVPRRAEPAPAAARGDLAPLPPRPREQRDGSRRRRRDRSPERAERVGVLLGAGDPDRRHRRPGTGSRRPEHLLAHNILEAPAGASENCTPPNPPKVPYVVFAHDGGLDSIRANYAAAAAGHPRGLAQSCYANSPGTIPGK